MAQTKPVTAVIVGGGHRAIIYGDYSLNAPREGNQRWHVAAVRGEEEET